MSEANTTLNHETFDLGAVLAGLERPEHEVTVYFNEKLGFTISQLNKAIAEAERRRDSELAEELQADLDGLVAKVKDTTFTVKLRALPEGERKAIIKTVRDKFPPKRDLLGREEENIEADEYTTLMFWASYITQVVDPSGKVSSMTEALAKELLDKAPQSDQHRITAGINELSEGAGSGFEYAAKEVDFLSTASTEG